MRWHVWRTLIFVGVFISACSELKDSRRADTGSGKADEAPVDASATEDTGTGGQPPADTAPRFMNGCVPACAAHQTCNSGKCSPQHVGAFSLPGVYQRNVVVSAQGDLLVWGEARSSFDLDPGTGVQDIIASQTTVAHFYAAYTKDGAYLWHRNVGAPEVEWAAPWGEGFLLAFNIPESETLDLGNGLVFSQRGGVIAALSKDGLPSEVLAVTGKWTPLSLATAGTSAWVFSTFEGQVRLGANGPSRTSMSGTDYLLINLDATTGVKWASVLDIVAGDRVHTGKVITALPGGGVFLAHPTWHASVDLDPGPGVKMVGSVQAESAFAAAYAADGSLDFGGELRSEGPAYPMSPGGLVWPEIARVDEMNGGILLAGSIFGDKLRKASVDLDLTSGEKKITSVTGYDIWLARYSTRGALLSAGRLASEGDDKILGISVSPRGYRAFFEFRTPAVYDDLMVMSPLTSTFGDTMMLELSPSFQLLSSFRLTGMAGPVASSPGGFLILSADADIGKTVINRFDGF